MVAANGDDGTGACAAGPRRVGEGGECTCTAPQPERESSGRHDAWERVENAHALCQLHLSLNANLLADTTARNKACWEWAGSVGCMKLLVRWR